MKKMRNLEVFEGLTKNELIEINGGGLVEDIGYGAHAVADAACQAYNYVAEQAQAAYEWVADLF